MNSVTTNMTLNELMKAHEAESMWTFSTFYLGVHSRSPRVFDNIEDALQAVIAKLKMHSLDHEFPMISLIRLQPRDDTV